MDKNSEIAHHESSDTALSSLFRMDSADSLHSAGCVSAASCRSGSTWRLDRDGKLASSLCWIIASIARHASRWTVESSG